MAFPCQSQRGVLTAERVGADVKLTVAYPDDYGDAFSLEYLAGHEVDTGDEVWAPVQVNGHRIVRGDTAYDRDMPNPRTYRALVYRLPDPDAMPGLLHTNGNFTDQVTA